ncbi:hypothetical protein GCM10009844_27110 [Nocardioides koreensis]|uniref:Bacterial Ig-like domain-containing protein n=1 Tax=Nocardioides koreensis TaxID=433651 RepID=A0ABN2ZX39_9ACTN
MTRTRPFAAALLLALATSGLVATGTSPTVANPAYDVSGTAPRAAARPPLIQGVVVDQLGHAVDDVDVRAIDSNGDPAASALTYASSRVDGPQHGYFYLEVGAVGSYTLRLKKPGYVSATVESVQVSRPRQRLALGELVLTKVLGTKTSASLADGRITADQWGKVRVTVTGGGTSRPAGTVEVRDGRKVVGTGRLRPSDGGKVVVTLKRLAAGSHGLEARFLGSKTLKASSARKVTLTVTKPRRHQRVTAGAR